MKYFILNLPFVKKIINEAIESAIEFGKNEYQFENLGAIKRLEQFKLQEVDELAQHKLQELLGSVNYKSIVTFDKQTRSIFIGGIKAEDSQLANLRAEAEFFLASELYKILSETKKDIAYKTMFEKSQNFEDMRAGKFILFDIAEDKKLINLFKSWQPVVRK